MLANLRDIGIQAAVTGGVLLTTSLVDSIDALLKILLLVVSIAYTSQKIYMNVEERREKRRQILIKKKEKHYGEKKKTKLKKPEILN